MKPLGSLAYHVKSCRAIAFAHQQFGTQSSSDHDDEMTSEEKLARDRWIAGGSEDGRISLWELIDFASSKET